MGLITKEITMTLHSQLFKYFENKGYEVPKREAHNHSGNLICYDDTTPITVKVEDLPDGSHQIVDVECDFCHKQYQLEYRRAKSEIDTFGTCACPQCAYNHTALTIQKIYGEQYTNTFQVPEIQERITNTLIDRYGVDNVIKIPGVQDKIRETCMEKYNAPSPLMLPEMRERIKATCKEKYGGNAPTSSDEVKRKVQETMYKNGSKMASRQQEYIGKLYNGIINYPLGRLSLDIALPEEKIVCEYNGSGHWLSIHFGDVTESEFIKKEIARNIYIKNNGYKMIIIISRHDKLPSDEILLAMLSAARTYFTTTEHTWIEYDIDQQTVRNALNKEGVFFDYGELRTIKQAA